MKVPVQSRRVGGFTLIELVISSALMTLILVSGYMCLSSALASQKMIHARGEVAQTARVALAMISADLRSATVLSKEFEFVGMDRVLGEIEADNLDFGTQNYVPRGPGEGDFCEVSYFVGPEPQSGKLSLWRRRDPTLDDEPLAGGGREEIARGVRGLRFEYYEGWEWFDDWGDPEGKVKAESSLLTPPNLSGLPEAVRITLWFDSNEKSGAAGEGEGDENSMVFQTVARINLARAQTGSGDAESSSTNNVSGARAAPPGGGTPP